MAVVSPKECIQNKRKRDSDGSFEEQMRRCLVVVVVVRRWCDGGLGEAITGPSSAGQFGRLPLNFSGGSNTAADCCWCWGRRPTGKVRPAAASLFPCDAGNFLEGRTGKTSDFRAFGQGKLRPIMLLPFYLVRAFPSEAELITSHTQLGTTCLSDQAGILCCHRLRC